MDMVKKRTGKGLMNRFDLFVFDWDGTLSNVRFERALNERLNPFWMHRKSEQRIALEKGKRKEEDEERQIKARTSIEGSFAPLVDLYFTFVKPKLGDGSLDVLKKLKKNGKKVALFTNAAEWRIHKELKLLGIEQYFDMVVSGQGIGAIKPSPKGLRYILDKLKVKKNRTLYSGDMTDDLIMAEYAGVPSCGMACGLDSYTRLEEMKPEYVFNDMKEFGDAL